MPGKTVPGHAAFFSRHEIMPFMKASVKTFQNTTTYTRAHRLLHWLIAFTFLFILLTVWLRMDWMNKDHIGKIVAAGLEGQNVHISAETAVAIGKSIRKPMWDMHVYAGYFLIALYLIRLLVMKIEGPVFSNPFSKGITSTERLKSAIYLVFYICLGASLLTGAYIKLAGKAYPGIYAVMKSVHVQSLYYALTFVVLHLGGLVLAELGNGKGIISRMIHGGRS